MTRFNHDFSSRFRILKGGKVSLVVSAVLGSAIIASAAPTGGVVTSGTANITQSGNTTNITQSTNKATINWQDFSIKSNETVNFNQPNVNSITLNRVVGNERSIIDGALNANGQVWILNSNGILFNSNAKINTAGLLATTKNITDADFNAGNYKFTGDSTAGVINMGTIEASDSGYVALLANTVQNDGTIKAYKGTVHLTGASEATINLNGNSIVSLTVNKGVLDALVENKGVVLADGGKIYLTTNAVDEILKGVVNNTGLIEANSLDDISGEVILFAHGGTGNVSGTIEAVGGFVETSGKDLSVADGTIIKAKKWLIDPENVVIESAGGNIGTASVSASVIETALITADIEIQATNDITVNQSINIHTVDTDEGEGVAFSSGGLTLTAGNDININEVITVGPNAWLTLNYGWNGTEWVSGNEGEVYGNGGAINMGMNTAKTAFTGKVNFMEHPTAPLSTANAIYINEIEQTIINNLTNLQNLILNDSTAKYVLGTDITDNTLFASIGNGIDGIDGSFTGTFNGLGHSITNLTISENGDWNSNVPNGVGLFGNIAGTANISNLALVSPTVTNTYDGWDIAPTGALVGYAVITNGMYHPTISNIIITDATVTATDTAGGAIGEIYEGVVNNVNVSTSTINGYSAAGGVIGRVSSSTIDGVSSIGNQITAETYGAGGIVGEFPNNSSIPTILQNSNASGNTIVANQDVGGIFGYIEDLAESSITLSNNYYKLDDTSLNETLGVITYGGIYAGQYNTWLAGSKAALVADDYLTKAPATASDAAAYVINDMQDLRNLLAFTNTPDMPIRLANDITLDAGFYLPMFNGFIDGKGYTLSGLNVNQPYNANIGLVGVLNGNIYNLILSSPTLSGYSNVGSLAGTMLAGVIYNTTATGVNISVEASDTDVENIGGLVGYADYTTLTGIIESSASGAIDINLAGNSGDFYSIENIGGLVGSVGGEASNGDTGIITNDVSKTTDVSITIGADASTSNYFSVASVGGLVGRNDAEIEVGGFLISNATATGDILISSENIAGLGAYRIGGAVGSSNYSLDNIVANNHITITATDDSSSIGGVIGRADAPLISNSSYIGDIIITTNGELTKVGGIAGEMRTDYSTISDSSSAGTITLTAPYASRIGGAVGSASDGTNFDTVTSSVAIDATNVVDGENIGGLVGYNYVTLDDDDTQFGTISNSFATGAITAPNIINVGGLVGYIEVDDSNADSVTLSHATGTVLGDQRVGGLVGLIDGEATSISDSYATGDVQGHGTIGGLVGKNDDGFVITNSYATGDVVSTGYGTAGGLVGINNGYIENSYAQGKVSSANGHEIAGLVGDNFGSIINSYATGEVYAPNGWAVGGLVGYQYKEMDDAILSGSYATGKVTGDSAVGGLVGGSNNTNIINSYATGEVIGDSQVGGLTGTFSIWDSGSAFMEKSYATGKVTGTDQIGGLIGYANGADIENVFATGDVINTSDASTTTGALIGMSVNGSVTTSYASGLITVGADTSANLGGLIGANGEGGTTVSDSFYNKTLNAGKSDEEISGKTTTELKTLATYTSIENGAWDMSGENGHYPILGFQMEDAETTWVMADGETPVDPDPVDPDPVDPTQNTNIEKVITTIVNNTINNVNLPKDILLPKVNPVQNMPILPMSANIQSSAMMQNIAQKLGVNEGEQLSLVSTAIQGQSTERITLGELKNLSEASNDSNEGINTPIETRVALGDNSIIELVNGGVSLPEGVDQEFYVVKNKKNKK